MNALLLYCCTYGYLIERFREAIADWNEEALESILYAVRFRARLSTPQSRKKLVELGLSALMQCLSGSQAIVELTIDMLQLLLVDLSSCKLCLDFDALNLTASVRSQTCDPSVHSKVEALIDRLKEVQSKGAIKEINKISNAIIIGIPLNSIHAVSIEEENRKDVIDGVDALLSSMLKCLEEEEVQIQAVDVILQLAMKNKLTLIPITKKKQMMSLLVRAMEVHPKLDKLLWRVCLTISVLRRQEDLVKLLNENGARQTVLNILREFSGLAARDLIQQALWALASLLHYGTNNLKGARHMDVPREVDMDGVVIPLILHDIFQSGSGANSGKDNLGGNGACNQSHAKVRIQRTEKNHYGTVDDVYHRGLSGLIDP